MLDGHRRRRDARRAASASGARCACGIGGEERWIAADDAGLYRDALGAAPPGGLPDGVPRATCPTRSRELVAPLRAHARPVHDRRAARRATASTWRRCCASSSATASWSAASCGRAASEREWCDVEVLRRLRRASLAALRKEIEPADQRALARFLPSWQGVDRHPAGAAPASTGCARCSCRCRVWRCRAEVWERDVLPRRVGAYSPSWMDQLCASGELVWVGAGALGRNSGRVALYFREDAALLGPPPRRARRPPAEPRARGCARAAARGACFFTDLLVDVDLAPEELQEALWDLAWAGEATNDAFAPLRAPRLTLARAQRERRAKLGTTGGDSRRAGAAAAPRRRSRGAGRSPSRCSAARPIRRRGDARSPS